MPVLAALCVGLAAGFPLLTSKSTREATLRPEAFASKAHSGFISNDGQWDNRVQFLAQSKGMNMWVTDSGVVLDLRKISGISVDKEVRGTVTNRATVRGHVVRMKYVGARSAEVQGSDRLATRYNFFKGNDPSRWAQNVLAYSEALSAPLYPGISARYCYDNGVPRYDLIVGPNADASKIAMDFAGADGLSVEEGVLNIHTSLGDIQHKGLYAYQDVAGSRRPVPCQFQVQGTTVGFSLGSYDRSKPIVIDPLVWSTFVGGTDNDLALNIALDSLNNSVVCGFTLGADFPTSVGAYDTSLNGARDIALAKVSADGSSLLWATYLGGSGDDEGWGVALDSLDNIAVTGHTRSSDFPMHNAQQGTFGGIRDAFVTKFDPNGGFLFWSTYLGGSSTDRGDGVAFDTSGNLYAVGFTQSNNFPTTPGAYGTGFAGGRDAYIAKYDTSGVVQFVSQIGGSISDRAVGVKMDPAGNPVFCGDASPGFPATPGAYSTAVNSDGDAYAASLSADGTTLLWSTFFGGSSFGIEFAWALALDGSGNVRLTGQTASDDFPITAGVVGTLLTGVSEAFVVELSPNGSTLNWSTYLGGAGVEVGNGIKVDGAGNTIVVGSTDSPDFPTTPDAEATANAGGNDWFVTKLNPSATTLTYSTYLGTSQPDVAQGLALDALGNAYVAGTSPDPAFPTTPGAYDTTQNGVQDFVVAKFGFGSPPLVNNDSFTAFAGQTLSIAAPGVLANDNNVAGGSVSQRNPGQFPQHAQSFTLNADGSFAYTPVSGFFGVDQFQYEVVTPSGSAWTTCSISVVCQLLSATVDSATVASGMPITGNVTVSQPVNSGQSGNQGRIFDGASQIGTVPNGTTTGTFSIPTAPSTTLTTLTLNLHVEGSNVIARSVTVTPIATAIPDEFFVAVNSAATVFAAPGVVANDSNLYGATALLATLPNSTAQFYLQANGAFRYRPANNFMGSDSFTYTLKNTSGSSSPALVNIQVVNAVKSISVDTSTYPRGANITGKVTLEKAASVLTRVYLSDNSFHVDAEAALVIVPVGQSTANFSVSTQSTSSLGSVTLRASLNNEVNVTKQITVGLVSPPTGVADSYSTFSETSFTGYFLLQNDIFHISTGTKSAQLVQGPANSSSFSLQPNGAFTYMGKPGFAGVDSFKYQPVIYGVPGNVTTVTITVKNRLKRIVVTNSPVGGSPLVIYAELCAPSSSLLTVHFQLSADGILSRFPTSTIAAGSKTSLLVSVPTKSVNKDTTVSLAAYLGNGGNPVVYATAIVRK